MAACLSLHSRPPRILTTLVIDGKHFVLTLFRFQSGLCSASVECATHVTGAERELHIVVRGRRKSSPNKCDVLGIPGIHSSSDRKGDAIFMSPAHNITFGHLFAVKFRTNKRQISFLYFRCLRPFGSTSYRATAGEVTVRARGVLQEPLPQPADEVWKAATAIALPKDGVLLRH